MSAISVTLHSILDFGHIVGTQNPALAGRRLMPRSPFTSVSLGRKMLMANACVASHIASLRRSISLANDPGSRDPREQNGEQK